MGIYSDFYISTTDEGYQAFVERARLEEDADVRMFLLNHPSFDADGHWVVFGWECVKWYHGFKDVDACLRILKDMEAAGVPWQTAEVCDETEFQEILETDGFYDRSDVRPLFISMNVGW